MNAPNSRYITTEARHRTAIRQGQSGNLKRRPKGALEIRSLFRQHTPEAVAALLKALKQPRYRVAAAGDPRLRLGSQSQMLRHLPCWGSRFAHPNSIFTVVAAPCSLPKFDLDLRCLFRGEV